MPNFVLEKRDLQYKLASAVVVIVSSGLVISPNV